MRIVLADEFFLLAHHDVDGRPRLHSRAVGLGLAAALVGELLSGRQVEIRDGGLVVVDRRPPADAVSHAVLDTLLWESQRHTVRVWLAFLSAQAPTQVADRLVRAGQLRVVTARRFLGPAITTYRPADMNKAAWPWASLSTRLRDGTPLDYPGACLAGLVLATGLDRWLLDGAAPAAGAYLRTVATGLWPPMRELLTYTEAAVGAAVMTHRA